jgi:predicted nucleotidyltransferase
MQDLSKLGAPAEVAEGLTRLAKDLGEAAGPNLKAVLLYGGLASGRFRPGRSDLNIAVILEDGGGAALEKIAPVLTGALRRLRVEPFVLTTAELGRSADVFPTKFLDIQRHHVVLAGADPFEGLKISREHVRLRIEQELRNTVLRLRRRLVTAQDDPVALSTVLVGLPVTLAVNLAALAELAGSAVETGADPIDTARRAGRALDLDVAALDAVAALKGEKQPVQNLAELTGRVLALVSAAAERADRLEVRE